MKAVTLQHNQELRVWDRLTILIGEGPTIGQYVARVEEFVNHGIIISRPEFVAGHTLLRNSVPVIVQVAREDGMYEFDSQLRLHDSDDIGHSFLLPPRSVRRVQRRQFVRIELSMAVDYAPVSDDIIADGNLARLVWRHTRSVDISASGILIFVTEPIEIDSLVLLRMNDLAPTGTPHRVLSVVRRRLRRKDRDLIGVEYILDHQLKNYAGPELLGHLPAEVHEFTEVQQDRLSSHLFEKQIELRKKGLI